MAKKKRQGGFGVFKQQIGAEDQPVGGPFKRGRETIAEKQARGGTGLGGAGGTTLGGTSLRPRAQTALGGEQGTGSTLGAGGTSTLGGGDTYASLGAGGTSALGAGGTSALGAGSDWQKAASSMGLKYGDYGGYSDAVSSATGAGEFGGEAIVGQQGGGPPGAAGPPGLPGGGPAGGVAGEAFGGVAGPRGGGPSGGVAGEVFAPRQPGPGGGGGGPPGGTFNEFAAVPPSLPPPPPGPGVIQGGAGGWGPYLFGNERGLGTSPMEDINFYGGRPTHRGYLTDVDDPNIQSAYAGGTGLLDPATNAPYPPLPGGGEYPASMLNQMYRFGGPGGRSAAFLRPYPGFPGPGSSDPFSAGLAIGMDELQDMRDAGGIENWLQEFWTQQASATAGDRTRFGLPSQQEREFGGHLGSNLRELEFGQMGSRSGEMAGEQRMENQLLFGKVDEKWLQEHPGLLANRAWEGIRDNGPRIAALFASSAMDAVLQGMRVFGMTDAGIAMLKNLDVTKHAGMLWNGNQAKLQLEKLDRWIAGGKQAFAPASDEYHSGFMLPEPIEMRWREYTGNPIRMDYGYNIMYGVQPPPEPPGTPKAYYLANMGAKDIFQNRIYLRGTSVVARSQNNWPGQEPPDATHMNVVVNGQRQMLPITYGDDPRMDGNNWTDKSWKTQFIHIPQGHRMYGRMPFDTNVESSTWFDQWFRGIYGGGAPEIAGADAQPGGQMVQPGGFQAGGAGGGGAGAGTGGFAVGGGGGMNEGGGMNVGRGDAGMNVGGGGGGFVAADVGGGGGRGNVGGGGQARPGGFVAADVGGGGGRGGASGGDNQGGYYTGEEVSSGGFVWKNVRGTNQWIGFTRAANGQLIPVNDLQRQGRPGGGGGGYATTGGGGGGGYTAPVVPAPVVGGGAPRIQTSLARPVGGGRSPGIANLANRAGPYAYA